MGEHSIAAVPGTAGRHPGAGPWAVLDQDFARLWRAGRGVLGVLCLWNFTTAATWVVMAMVKLVWFIQGSV